ncbi:hypothetical protein TTRE_0000165701 [Trichuris trichiura]|uniref:Uncharacterized protein n=1 Tax=Trichuris trichiura TaxID=36087 RepID=A0A077Z0Z4_TRITR|nr:hypothetical protein TTRE_0000165701 [Trichuris trichiura]
MICLTDGAVESKRVMDTFPSCSVTLNSVLKEHFRNQHAQCKKPVLACQPFSIFREHKCPEFRARCEASSNFTERIFERQVLTSSILTTSLMTSQLFHRFVAVLPTIRRSLRFPQRSQLYLQPLLRAEILQLSNSCVRLQLFKIYDIATGSMVVKLYDEEVQNNYADNRATFRSCGNVVLSDGIIWDVRTAKAIHKFDKLNDQMSGIFHPNGLDIIIDTAVWDFRTFRARKFVDELHKHKVIFNSQGDVLFSSKPLLTVVKPSPLMYYSEVLTIDEDSDVSEPDFETDTDADDQTMDTGGSGNQSSRSSDSSESEYVLSTSTSE